MITIIILSLIITISVIITITSIVVAGRFFGNAQDAIMEAESANSSLRLLQKINGSNNEHIKNLKEEIRQLHNANGIAINKLALHMLPPKDRLYNLLPDEFTITQAAALEATVGRRARWIKDEVWKNNARYVRIGIGNYRKVQDEG